MIKTSPTRTAAYIDDTKKLQTWHLLLYTHAVIAAYGGMGSPGYKL